MALVSLNPTTEEVLATFQEHTPEEVEQALSRAWETFQRWRLTPWEERSALMRALARHLRQRRDEMARLITLEMGKPIVEAEAEVLKCAWCCDYFADNAHRFLSPLEVETNATRSYVQFVPLGPILAIMPWNFPFSSYTGMTSLILPDPQFALAGVPACAGALLDSWSSKWSSMTCCEPDPYLPAGAMTPQRQAA